ncbi:hypothetical protein P4493_09795 [Bacillus thuringiensis]|uniref:Uncharacterized protein n=3 Tax=Bacillus thuringiensis TaxID=1428 RepID=A0AB35PA72_BACTU|nr:MULTISPECIES: hypothetical protein [Bacillus]MEC3434503.1 hypothetical protein [Bacillus cereus]AFQ30425.1 hypothetical protein BTF1_31627 [Bacillus thuringiensis HD-789]AJH02435.1 putative membrane protein [Bacillus thuringiensis HD1002]AND28612.1 hypothetical protein ATN07_33430 [Bacillus thuringiensis serovar israelensis]EXL36879.1 hypothetical protein BG78_23045 [Bacillus thuringiensis serovar israelensis]
MREKAKKIADNFKFMTLLLVVEVVMFFICKVLVRVELLFHPYTKVGAMMLSFGQHILFGIFGFIITILLLGGNKK